MWILGNARRELSAFYALAVLIILSFGWWHDRPIQTFLILFVTVGVDTSHVYATAWRAWFDPKEMKRAKWLHLGVPLAVLAVCFLWCGFGIPGFWSFVLYLTVFHHIRQFYGIHRWSLALNRPKGPECTHELYALTILPFVGYHFRLDVDYQGFFTPQDMLRFPNQNILYAIYFLCGLAVLSFSFKMAQAYRAKTLSLPVISTVIFPSFINIFCFLISRNFFLSLLPVLAVHGMSYYHLSAHAQGKLRQGWWQKYRVALIIIVVTSITLGFFESWLTNDQIDIIPSNLYAQNWLLAFGVAFVTTPSIYHYIADAFLWKRTHPDFAKIVKGS